MPEAGSRSPDNEELEAWETQLIKSVVTRYDVLDREDLEAELAWRLLVLKRGRGPEIRNWRAYVSKFLCNKASDWIRKTRPRERSTLSLDAPLGVGGEEADQTLADLLHFSETDPDRRLELKHALAELPSNLQTVLRILTEEGWNQTIVARRLRRHRNTIRTWIRRIRQTLIAHGLAPELDTKKASVSRAVATGSGSLRDRERFIVISYPVIEALGNVHLSGSQWRLILWVISQCSMRKQRTVPFSWRGIGRALVMDHVSMRRAGTRLLSSGVLFIDCGRIGFERGVHRWRIEGARVSRQPSPGSGERKHRF